MTSQSLRSGIAAALTAIVAAGLWAAAPAVAQVVTGTLGSPSATTTIPGNQIPAPAPKFGGVIKRRRHAPRSPGGRRPSRRPRARPTSC